MRTATIALLLAAVNAADAVKDATKKAAGAAAATGAAENQGCNSKTDKTGCAAGLKCAIGMTPEPTKEQKAAAEKKAKDDAAKAAVAGQKLLDAQLAAAITKWNADTKAVADFAADKKLYDDGVAANTTCLAITKNRTNADLVKKCKALGGVAWTKIDPVVTLKTETAKTKYECAHTAHTWKADATKTVPEITVTQKDKTITTTTNQCTLDKAKYADAAACKTAVDADVATKKEAAATANAGKPEADHVAPEAAITCCAAPAAKEDTTNTWTVASVVYTRAVDSTTNEEQWTYKSSTATTTGWDRNTGAVWTTTTDKAAYDKAAAAAFPVVYSSLKVAPKTWAASTKSAEYNAGTAASSVNVASATATPIVAQKLPCPAVPKFGKLYTSKDAKAPAAVVPKVLPKKGDSAYVYNLAKGITGAPKAAAPAKKEAAPAKKEEPKKEAAKADATKKDAKADATKKDAKAATVPDGPGKCVKEALCDTNDAKTAAKITCDAVRLGAAALAALAVASTL